MWIPAKLLALQRMVMALVLTLSLVVPLLVSEVSAAR